ncbi:MAG: acetyl-CoA carboxylase biotin carboxyl carrier protein [Vicinamibacterales bacterium]
MPMNLDDIKEILELVRDHNLVDFELERDGLKIRIRKAGHELAFVAPSSPLATAQPPLTGAAPAAVPGAAGAGAPPVSDVADPVNLAVIKSPIVGTFYLSPEPSAPSFVEIGDTVRKGQVLCIIEAMKLMNEIESDCDGELAAIYVENGKAVQFGERLFAVKVG